MKKKNDTINNARNTGELLILCDENVDVTIIEKELDDIIIDSVKISSLNDKNNVIETTGLNLLYLLDLMNKGKFRKYRDYKIINFGNAKAYFYNDGIIISQNKNKVKISFNMLFKVLSIYREIYLIHFDLINYERNK